MKRDYSDIIHLSHPTSLVHPRMSLLNRAAQFAPFAALTGFEDAIVETARPTDARLELTDSARASIDACLHEAAERISVHDSPWVTLTCFFPDEKKEGGMYATFNAQVLRIEPEARTIRLGDGTELRIDDLYAMEMLQPMNGL